jgi:hypothetical protein
MSGSLISLALRAIRRRGRFKPAAALAAYLRDNNIGAWEGEHVRLGPRALADLEAALERDYQVPPGTSPEAWEDASRTEALALTTNEKTSVRAVRAARVAVKALAGATIRIGNREHELLPGMSIDASAAQASLFLRHDAVLLVENWEAFERIDRLNFGVPEALVEALVVYRGDYGAYPIGAVREFLDALDRPVYVFPDPDPAGLKLAMDFPRYAGLVLPPVQALREMLDARRGDVDRYVGQLPGSERALEACEDPVIQSYWRVIRAAGRAIPQEEFVRE